MSSSFFSRFWWSPENTHTAVVMIDDVIIITIVCWTQPTRYHWLLILHLLLNQVQDSSFHRPMNFRDTCINRIRQTFIVQVLGQNVRNFLYYFFMKKKKRKLFPSVQWQTLVTVCHNQHFVHVNFDEGRLWTLITGNCTKHLFSLEINATMFLQIDLKKS